MSTKAKSDLWREILAEAVEDMIDRAASVTVEQAEAELRAAGFDVAAERAKASAFLDALETPPRPPGAVNRRQRGGGGRP